MSSGAAAAKGAGGRRWELETGAELGPWRILEPLGAGGMGEVYVAEHSWLPTRRAALKVLQVERLGASRFADRFRAEAALLASIDHPNVVRLYDAQITEDGRAWMAMELLSGKALNELLREQGRTDIPDTLQILGDVADGAHAAHLLGIVHRDLKPGNIFITSKHVAKVLDFGTSKLLEHRLTLRRLAPSTEQNVVLGTIPFMSPEQLLGQALDHRSDIYALGVIAYQMLTGQHPFVRSDERCGPEQYGYRALFTEPTPIDTYIQDCPMELWLLIRSALGRKREDRPSSMAKMAEKMRALRGEYLAERGLPIASLGDLLGSAAAPGAVPASGVAPRQSAPPEQREPAAALCESPAPPAMPSAPLEKREQTPQPLAPLSVPSAPLEAGDTPVPYAAALATDVVSPLSEAELEALQAAHASAEGLAVRSFEPPRPLALASTERSPTRGSSPPAAWAHADLRELRATVRMGPDELAAEFPGTPSPRPSPSAGRSSSPLPGAIGPMVPSPRASPLPGAIGPVVPRTSTGVDRLLARQGISRRVVAISGVVVLALAFLALGGFLRLVLPRPSQASGGPGSSLVSPESAPSGTAAATPGPSATSPSSPAPASAATAPSAAAPGSGAPAQAGGADLAKPQPSSSPSTTAAGRGSSSGGPAGRAKPSNSPSSRPSAYPPATPSSVPTHGLIVP